MAFISNLANFQGPVGPLKEMRVIDVQTDVIDAGAPYEDSRGFIVRIVGQPSDDMITPTIVVTTMSGYVLTFTSPSLLDFTLGVGNIPVLVTAIHPSSNIVRAEIGFF